MSEEVRTASPTEIEQARLLATDIAEMYEWWDEHVELLPADTVNEFCERVHPCYLPGASREQSKLLVSQAYTEWVIFERVLDEWDATPAEVYLQRFPPLSKDVRARLELVAKTQFFSRFAILTKDADSSICELFDMEFGGRYRVLSETLAAQISWRDGTVAVRIARVAEDLWSAIGDTYLYDCVPVDLVGIDTEIAGDGSAALEPSRYIGLLADVIGARGRHVESARVRQQEQ